MLGIRKGGLVRIDTGGFVAMVGGGALGGTVGLASIGLLPAFLVGGLVLFSNFLRLKKKNGLAPSSN